MRYALYGAFAIAGFSAASFAGPRVDKIPLSEFDRLHALIKPGAGESPWREIPWVTNVTEARRRAVKEDRAIVVFTAADGSPLGRT